MQCVDSKPGNMTDISNPKSQVLDFQFGLYHMVSGWVFSCKHPGQSFQHDHISDWWTSNNFSWFVMISRFSTTWEQTTQTYAPSRDAGRTHCRPLLLVSLVWQSVGVLKVGVFQSMMIFLTQKSNSGRVATQLRLFQVACEYYEYTPENYHGTSKSANWKGRSFCPISIFCFHIKFPGCIHFYFMIWVSSNSQAHGGSVHSRCFRLQVVNR